jgi:hypothetical protein
MEGHIKIFDRDGIVLINGVLLGGQIIPFTVLDTVFHIIRGRGDNLFRPQGEIRSGGLKDKAIVIMVLGKGKIKGVPYDAVEILAACKD